jgi:hypothetical protein
LVSFESFDSLGVAGLPCLSAYLPMTAERKEQACV